MKTNRLKIDLLLAIQLNKYDEAYALAQQILQISPKDQLIEKFNKFLQQHKTQMKQIDQEEVEVLPVPIEYADSDGSEWQSDCDSDLSLDSENESEGQQLDRATQHKSIHKTPQKMTHECKSLKSSPVRNPSVGSIKKLQPKMLQPARSSLIKKPIEVVTFDMKGFMSKR